MPNRTIIASKPIFIVTIIIIIVTVVGIWLFGIGQHKTLFQNGVISTTILSIVFFLFLTICLYKGIKLKDNIGRITDKIKVAKWSDMPGGIDLLSGGGEVGHGIEGIIFGILLWILVAILILIFIWFFNTIILAMIFAFVAMLYWIFFRVLRLVFKNAVKCKGRLLKSMSYGFSYTVLYNFWIYGIILLTHYSIR